MQLDELLLRLCVATGSTVDQYLPTLVSGTGKLVVRSIVRQADYFVERWRRSISFGFA
jgi:hypothetical protein